ncbi:MAG TPA: amino acid adenylation domain-containing protein [Pyrinomonadaceae bacterium]|jgi:amino acid adenylation domain-containing protein/non-ribosomal peptide synthase protein (TIGR01720 family)
MSSLIQSPAEEHAMPEPSEAQTLVELLRLRAREGAGRNAYTFLVDGELEEVALTYGELDRQARRIGAWLQANGCAGGRVLLLYPPGLEFIAAFFGCLYAGAVAVPAYPPRRNRNLLRLQSLVADAGASAALTTERILSRITPQLSEDPLLGSLRWLASDDAAAGAGGVWEDAWVEPRVTPEGLAFLQYTSGSTSAPKGVMVSHGNVLHNERLIRRAFGQTALSTTVGWLPVYHDMGLIGNVIQPLYVGAPCVLMSPVAFLQSPVRWLQAISRFGATTSGGPNFAYDLCARKVTEAQRESLDLSSWQVAFNGAEPVRLETLERFSAAFGPCGFRREAFLPCYGLAEATLLVSGSRRGAPPRVGRVQAAGLEGHRVVEAAAGDDKGVALVGCGEAADGQQLAIVHPQTLQRRAPDEVGEIWVAGPSVARGYWNRPEETERTFRARVAGTGEGPFLRTGDLGFFKDGELFVTGRLKDVIIIRGLNHYPQDIEHTVERCHASLRPGCGAAFSVQEGGGEQLVVVQEADARGRFEPEALFASVNEALAREHELQAHAVVLIRPGSLPKTSSGKIQRHACRRAFVEGGLDVLARWDAGRASVSEVAQAPEREARGAASELEEWLRALLAKKLGADVRTIDAEQPISRYGLDSLAAIELMHEVEAQTGVKAPFSLFLDDASVAGLAAHLLGRRGDDSAAPRPAATRDGETAACPHADGRPLDDERPLADGRPLTYGQRALWFLYRMAPESAAYNLTNAARFVSPVDVDVLRRAFRRLVERHASLRTTFGERDGQPVQRVHARAEVDFDVRDAASLDEGALRRLLNEEAARPFDLERGPLLRVRVYARPSGGRVLQLSMHHIVADFWSLAVLMHELGVLYAAELKGEPAALEAPAEDYTDYARRQVEMLRGEGGERLWRFWQGELSGELPVLNLPADRPRPGVQTFDGASEFFKLDAELSARVKEYARRRGATLYTTLLAAFQTLLHRYTGQTDVVVGSPTADRGGASAAGVVGYFVNPVVLRSDFSGDPSFDEAVERVRRTALGAFEHQSYPFPLLVERLQPERDPGRSPLFQTMFVFQKSHLPGGADLGAFALGEEGARLELGGGLRLESVSLDQRVAQFDLTLALAEAGEELRGALQYNTALFDAATVARMAGHFETLLRAAVGGPARPVSSLPLLTRPESRRLLVEWNDTARAYPRGGSIHGLFEAQAARTPGAVALVDGDARLTYGELDARAGRLARTLRARGVGPETLVGVYMRRSAEMVVALLGVLKAGGAYVPLDPAYPSSRLEFILEDARAALVLTQRTLAATLPAGGAGALCLDGDWEEEEAREPGDVKGAGAPHDALAYVIYTSGSTGRPKGVAIEHRSAVTLLHWAGENFDAEQLRGVLAATSICFDLSVFELFAPLSWGGTVILAENALQLPALPAKDEVTLVNTVPSVMAELLRTSAAPDAVRVVNLAGEALPAKLVQEIHRRHAAAEVINLYGPSEDTTYSTMARLRREDSGQPPIGRPIANTQAYVLDANLQPAPAGVPGELYLSGEGLARGYLNRPALTAERFIPHPHATEPGARLYRTGDIARHLPDGQLEYLARADNQVKVRGFRIELGEIEAVLEQHADVAQAVVVAREDSPGDRRLVAYVVGRGGDSPTVGGLRAFVRERLPEYMAPSSFVFLEAMPLTPNGKIDRRALPAPSPSLRAEEISGARPATAVEEVLARLWADVLDLERVGADDNFFELGGHSLLATRLLSRVRTVFDRELPLRAVFESPTLTGMAALIEAALAGGESSPLPPLRPAPRDAEPPLSSAQQRLWFLDRMEPDSPFYNVPAALRLTGELNDAALEGAINEVVRRHEVLRTTFPAVEGRAVQRIAAALWLPLARVELARLPAAEREAEARRLVAEEAARPFDLVRGPLMRVGLLRLGAREHVLLLTMHHIVTDGWSLGVLVREVGALYAAYAEGRPSPLEELEVQYADYACWQQEWLRGEALASRLDYWKRRLEGAPSALELPTDRPRPPVQSYRGATRKFDVPADLSRGLKALGRREGVTPFMTLLAGFFTLLQRYTGQEDIVVGTPIANRTRGEIEPLVGFFVNTLALRARPSRGLSFGALLGQVREVTLGAYAHQDIPFEKLVDELRPERDMSRPPLFQVMFAMQNTPGGELELPGVSLKLTPSDSGASKFDLTLFMEEGEEGFVGSWEYNTDLFEAQTIERMSRHLLSLLGSAAADPGRPLSELRLLSDDERRLLVEGYNDTRVSYADAALPLQRIIERQAALSPDAVAVASGGERLSYAELNARANRLARHLRSLGVGAETRVGVLMERSTELVVSLLAVLKAGGAYVPLDPEYPPDRLHFMLEDSRAPVLLMQGRLRGAAGDYEGRVVAVDELADELSALSGDDFPEEERGAGGSSLAYVIYTSGSTGRPKGAMNSHAGIVNRLVWMQEAFGLDASDVVLQKTPFSFDVSVWEFFWPLMTGARLMMARPGGHRDAAYLREVIRRESVTTLHFVPSMLGAWLGEQGPAEAPASLRRVICSGEALGPELQERFWGRLPGVELHNLYGPTEAAVDVTWWACRRDWARGTVPIGRPVANTSVHVLDARLEPAPEGVAGELYLGGVQVGRGYLDRPGLTAERFLPDPFSAEPGARLYRTGDVARRVAGGEVEYLGRVDHQVKLRGFRIELGEIEAALSRHPAVGECVCVVREDAPGVKRLVAYVGGARGANAAELAEHLRGRLPEYMTPTQFVFLEALPLTPSGKVDRKALPRPDYSGAGAGREFVAPASASEQALCGIWAEVLRLERVGVHDNFFELGGDSILSIQIIARAAQAGLHFTPRQLFQNQTIAELAAVAGAGAASDAEQGAVVGDVPLSPVQRWYFESEPVNPHHFNQALLLEVKEPLDAGLLRLAVEHLYTHHDALRLRFERGADGWRQFNAGAAPPGAFRTADFSGLDEAAQAGAVQETAARVQGGLNLSEGPLLRAVLFDLGAGRAGRLLLVAHHLVIDGVSWRILLDDLQTAYGQLSRGEAVGLGAKTASYRQWAEALCGHARSGKVEAGYWLGAAQRGAAPLPVDGRGENTVASSAVVEAGLDEEETRSLIQQAPAVYHTRIDEALLAALAHGFRQWGVRRLLLDVEGHGRDEQPGELNLSRTVGWFTAVYPLLLEAGEGGGVTDALKNVKGQARAVPGRGVGYGLLRYLGEEGVAARLRAAPAAEVSFNYLGQLDQALAGSAMFRASRESAGPSQDPRERRRYLIEVSASVLGGRLRTAWTYSENVHRRATVERLAAAFTAALRDLVSRGRAGDGAAVAPSDFPLAKLDQQKLNKLAAMINKRG